MDQGGRPRLVGAALPTGVKAWSVTATSNPDGCLGYLDIDPAAPARLSSAAATRAPVLSPADAERALAVTKSLIDGIDATGMVTITLAFGGHREPEIEDIALGPGTPADHDDAFLGRAALHLFALMEGQ